MVLLDEDDATKQSAAGSSSLRSPMSAQNAAALPASPAADERQSLLAGPSQLYIPPPPNYQSALASPVYTAPPSHKHDPRRAARRRFCTALAVACLVNVLACDADGRVAGRSAGVIPSARAFDREPLDCAQ